MREWGKKVVITLECGLGTFILLERTVHPLEGSCRDNSGVAGENSNPDTFNFAEAYAEAPLYGECKLGSLTAYHEGY